MTEPTERDPLITKPAVQANAEGAGPDVKRRLGPLEISASNRRGILAGIWLASFLGVRGIFLQGLLLLILEPQSLNCEANGFFGPRALMIISDSQLPSFLQVSRI
jgi:hypothetical protein